MKLSIRLNTIIEMLDKCRCLLDIGTDHAFVPIEAVSLGIAEKAIASDVRKGPLNIALNHINESGLSERIDVRLSDGLKMFFPNEADEIVIAGMGGNLIVRILKERQDILDTIKALIVSPHTDVYSVRKTIYECGFYIADEEIIEEEGKYYTVIKAYPSKNGSDQKKDTQISDEELQFGPVLLKKKTTVFQDYLKREKRIIEKIIGNLKEQEKNVRIEVLIIENEKKLESVEKILNETGSV